MHTEKKKYDSANISAIHINIMPRKKQLWYQNVFCIFVIFMYQIYSQWENQKS